MQLKPAVVFVFIITAVGGVGRTAEVDGAVAKILAADYALRCTAAFDPTDDNRDATFALLAPDFISIDPKGQETTRDDYVTQSNKQMKMLRATTCYNRFLSISSNDPGTIVVVNAFHLEGKVQLPGGKHDVVLTQRSQDTWTNVDGHWLATQGKTSRILVKVDGNVVQDLGS